MNTEKRHLQWNYIFHVSYQILTIILPIITAPYVSRVLRPECVGQYSYATTWGLVYIMIAALGTGVYGIREISYVREDKRAVTRLFWEIMLLRILGTVLIAPFYLLQMWLQPEYRLIMAVVGVQILGAAFDISWLFQGLEDFKRTVARSMVVRIISVILIFTVVKNPHHVVRYTWINSLGVMLGNFALWFYLPRLLTGISWKELRVRKHIIPSCALLVPTLSIYIYTFCNKLILGLMTNDMQVGYFSQPYSVITLLMTVSTSLSTVLVPNISHLISENQMEEVQQLIRKSFRYVLFLGCPLMAGVMCVSGVFVTWFFGPGYEASILLMRMMAVLPVLVGPASITGMAVLVPMKKQNIYAGSILTAAGVSLILDLILIPRYQAAGATMAMLAAEGTVAAVQMYYVCRTLKFGRKELFADSRNYWFAAGLMIPVIIWMPEKIGNGFRTLLLMAITGAVVYILALIVMRDEYIRYILETMKQYLKKKGYTMEEKKIDAVISEIMIVLLMVSIAVACSIQKLLDPVLHVEINEKIWLLGLELLILVLLFMNKSLLRHWRKIKELWFISGLACVLIASGAYKSMVLNGMSFRMTVFYSVPYFYVIMSVPIALLIINKNLKLKKLLNWILICSIVSYGIRIFISGYFGKTGIIILPSIALEGAGPNWVRNGTLRLNPPVFVSLLLPFAAYLFMESKQAWKKFLYALASVVIVYFTFRVHIARSFMIYHVLTLVIIWLVSAKKITWRECLILLVVAMLVVHTKKFQDFVCGLSLKNTGKDGTTGVRINVIRYFAVEYLKSPFWGIGYLDGDAARAVGGGHMGDIGMLQTIYTMGLTGVLYVVLVFVKSLKAVWSVFSMRYDKNIVLLIIASTVSFWMHNINVDNFSGYLFCVMPIFLVLLEFKIYVEGKKRHC